MENVENRMEMVENPTADQQTGEVIDYERLYHQASESVAELTAERDSLLTENTELRAARDDAIADGQKTKELNYTLARQLNIQQEVQKQPEEIMAGMFLKKGDR